ncbi:hypothetical protein JB92DRAFT_2833075 [Gautieria morchelliformis]|nr:hypothetical protein JB92DRAFT_2833075 [Gautieria morchelliformis]
MIVLTLCSFAFIVLWEGLSWADDTIARVVTCILTLPSSKILMDVTSIVPYFGDPARDNCEENIPDDTTVSIWAVQAVANNVEYGADSKTRLFNLAVSEYIQDGTKSFLLGCMLNV